MFGVGAVECAVVPRESVRAAVHGVAAVGVRAKEHGRGFVPVRCGGRCGGLLHVGDGQLNGDAVLDGDAEPLRSSLRGERRVVDDRGRAFDVIGEEARN